jgi:hypothetical protein
MTKLTHIVSTTKKIFTEDNIKVTKKYINPDVWPEYFDNTTLKIKFEGLKYIKRTLIDIDSIIFDPPEDMMDQFSVAMREFILKKNNKLNIQKSRANGRGEFHEQTWRSIRNKGYELCHMPMSVCKLPDKRIWLINGRTRIEELIRLGFKNIIADYYECSNYSSFEKFSLFSNPPGNARSPQTKEDVVQVGIAQIKKGSLQHNNIYDFVQDVSGSVYDTSTIGKIVKCIIEGKESTSMSYSDEGAREWLNSHGYHDNVNNNGIFYFVSSKESSGSAVLAAAKHYRMILQQGQKVKEIRIIINPGTLTGASAEDSWKKKVDKYREDFNSNFEIIKSAYFVDPQLSKIIKLYGVIPSVVSMAEDYPLEKLVLFHIGKLKYSSFREIDEENGLSRLLDIDNE